MNCFVGAPRKRCCLLIMRSLKARKEPQVFSGGDIPRKNLCLFQKSPEKASHKKNNAGREIEKSSFGILNKRKTPKLYKGGEAFYAKADARGSLIKANAMFGGHKPGRRHISHTHTQPSLLISNSIWPTAEILLLNPESACRRRVK
jgi:hypothetical protein